MIWDPANSLLTVKEVSQRLRICLATAYEIVRQGKLPSVRVGNRRGAIRVREKDVESYLTQGVQVSSVAEVAQKPKPAKVQLKHLRIG